MYGRDPSGAKVKFRGFNVGGACGMSGAQSVTSCVGAAALVLESLAFRGLRSAGGGDFYDGFYSAVFFGADYGGQLLAERHRHDLRGQSRHVRGQ